MPAGRTEGPSPKDLKPVYTAATQAKPLERFAEFAGTWEALAAIIKLWEAERADFTPLLGLRPEDLLITTPCISMPKRAYGPGRETHYFRQIRALPPVM